MHSLNNDPKIYQSGCGTYTVSLLQLMYSIAIVTTAAVDASMLLQITGWLAESYKQP